MSHRRSRPHRKATKPEESREPFFDRNRSSDRHFFSPGTLAAVQTKLEMGKPGDRFEREADAVADSVVNGQANSPLRQKTEESLHRQAEEEEMAQTKLQMQEEEEEMAQTKLQMQEEEEEETAQTKLQMQEEEEEETAQTKLQMQEEEEEETVQTKLQMQSEEEEMAQTKSESEATTASPTLADRIRQTKGSGNPLPDRTRAEMESNFGKDFSMVRIHTDNDAVDMNRQLKSQAFAQGKDLYFNQGKFDPKTKAGKHLLAHELAHVVQQNKAKPNK